MSKGAESLLERLGDNFIEAATGVAQGDTAKPRKRKAKSNVVAISQTPAEPKQIREGDQPTIPLSQITVAEQSRKHFDKEAISELAGSIRALGVVQPIVVRPRANQMFELVAGERRYRAARLAGLDEIPACIRNLTDTDKTMVQLIENVARQNLRPVEQANGIQTLMNETTTTARQLAKKLGLNHATVSRSLSLLKLEHSIQQRVDSGELSPRHGREIARIDDHNTQKQVASTIIRQQVTATQTEELVQQMLGQKRKPSTKSKKRRGPLPLSFGQPDAKVRIVATPTVGATYHDVEQEMTAALEEVRIRINNRVEL